MSKHTRKHIGDFIHEKRKAFGWSLETLATESGITKTHVWEIEKGNTNPTVVVAIKLANALGTTVSTLCGEPVEHDALIRRGYGRAIEDLNRNMP